MDEETLKLMQEIYKGVKDPTALDQLSIDPDEKRGLTIVGKLIYKGANDPLKIQKMRVTLVSVLDTPFNNETERAIFEYFKTLQIDNYN